MRHHLERAKYVYDDRGFLDFAVAAISYLPIELNNLLFRFHHGEGIHVMETDWDTLILLDACRCDMFSEQVPFNGNMESRISLGSTSEEFLRRNFRGEKFHDTVYVNANVYFSKLGLEEDQTFHAVIDLLDEWDEELEIAHPETVTRAAKRAHRQYPNKRIIVHYMQPHIPFIGQEGRKIQERIGHRNAWVPFRNGDEPVSIQELWHAYSENLDVVFDYVSKLLDEINGKIVISSDHGNMVGERQGPIPTKRMFGHPWGVYTRELVNVPWFVLPFEERRNIMFDTPVANQEHSEELILERLNSLGYR